MNMGIAKQTIINVQRKVHISSLFFRKKLNSKKTLASKYIYELGSMMTQSLFYTCSLSMI